MGFVMRNEQTGNRLTDVHTENFNQIAHLYDDQDPYQLETYRSRARDIAPMFTPLQRGALVDGLLPYLKQIEASESALQQAKRLLNPESVAIVTGQQAGLFTGPMYSISKALTVIGLAKSLEADLSRPVVPVFWVASEDHDWAEVNHAYILNQQDEVSRVVIGERAEPHQMVCHTTLSEQAVDACLKQVSDLLPDGPFKLDMVIKLKAAWKPGDSLSIWYARLMAVLFANHGLVIVDPCLPALRRLVVPVWKQAIFHNEQVQTALETAYREVIEAGFIPEVERDPTNSTLFYVENCKRFVLETTSGGMLRERKQDVERPLRHWANIADLDASRFSSNVLLRPLVQDYLLPTLAYIGGPSEVSYHALSRAVFHAHGRTLPPLVLRQRMTLFPTSVARIMENRSLSLDDVLSTQHLVSVFLREKGSGEIEQAMEAQKEQIQDDWTEFVHRFESLGPQVDQMVRAHVTRVMRDRGRLKKGIVRLLEQTLADEVRQLRHLERWLWTDGHPQERRLCPLNVWTKYSHEFVSQLPMHSNYRTPAPMYHVYL